MPSRVTQIAAWCACKSEPSRLTTRGPDTAATGCSTLPAQPLCCCLTQRIRAVDERLLCSEQAQPSAAPRYISRASLCSCSSHGPVGCFTSPVSVLACDVCTFVTAHHVGHLRAGTAAIALTLPSLSAIAFRSFVMRTAVVCDLESLFEAPDEPTQLMWSPALLVSMGISGRDCRRSSRDRQG